MSRLAATNTLASLLTCPFDHEPLLEHPGSLRCLNGHSFDIAREGYVNLLPVQYKKTKDPGDSKLMVQARHAFLSAGFYDPIAEALNRICLDLSKSRDEPLHILDAGCGEGFYLRRLGHALQNLGKKSELIGLDISKPAIQKAAKTDRSIAWLVASGKQPPLAPQSLHLILCLFGFCFYEDFAALLKPGGYLVRIDAGPEHLIELRERIYPELKPAKVFDYSEAERAGMQRIADQSVSFKLPKLNEEALFQLLAMTPHLYRANKELLSQLEADSLPELSVDVCARIFQKVDP